MNVKKALVHGETGEILAVGAEYWVNRIINTIHEREDIGLQAHRIVNEQEWEKGFAVYRMLEAGTNEEMVKGSQYHLKWLKEMLNSLGMDVWLTCH